MLYNTAYSVTPLQLFQSIIYSRRLIYSLIHRDIISRYRGSVMGLLWSFFNPVLMLIVYTIFFSTIFKARWPGGTDSKTEFALVLFSGLMVFNLFSECVNKAPSLIISNVNYVKKIVFPIEILPIVSLGSAFFHFGISFLVWIIFYCIFFGVPKITILMLPVTVIPLILTILGVSWFLASLGVYLRDASQIMGIITTILMFASPIFYPITALPEAYQPFLKINPLTNIIEQTRNVLIWGEFINWYNWMIQTLFTALLAWLGFFCFQKIRKGFADVL